MTSLNKKEEFNVNPVTVLENWHNVLDCITKRMYKNAFITNLELKDILERELCIKIEDTNWDSWKDED